MKGPQLGKKRGDEGYERGKIGRSAIYVYLYRTLYPIVKKTLKGQLLFRSGEHEGGVSL